MYFLQKHRTWFNDQNLPILSNDDKEQLMELRKNIQNSDLDRNLYQDFAIELNHKYGFPLMGEFKESSINKIPESLKLKLTKIDQYLNSNKDEQSIINQFSEEDKQELMDNFILKHGKINVKHLKLLLSAINQHKIIEARKKEYYKLHLDESEDCGAISTGPIELTTNELLQLIKIRKERN